MSEHNEAVLFSDWCRLNNVDCWHIQQEMWTPSFNQLRKQKQEGVRKGISDYLVVLPKSRCNRDKAIILFIELKKGKVRLKRKSKNGEKGDWVEPSDSKASQEQIDFLALVSEVSCVEGYIAYGGDEAISKVSKYLK